MLNLKLIQCISNPMGLGVVKKTEKFIAPNNTLQDDASTVTRYAAQNPRRQRVAPELNR